MKLMIQIPRTCQISISIIQPKAYARQEYAFAHSFRKIGQIKGQIKTEWYDNPTFRSTPRLPMELCIKSYLLTATSPLTATTPNYYNFCMSLTLSPIDQDIQNKNPTKKEARFIISYRNLNLFCPKEPRSKKTNLFSFFFFSQFLRVTTARTNQ